MSRPDQWLSLIARDVCRTMLNEAIENAEARERFKRKLTDGFRAYASKGYNGARIKAPQRVQGFVQSFVAQAKPHFTKKRDWQRAVNRVIRDLEQEEKHVT